MFGRPRDTGISADEGLALFTQADLQNWKYSYLFLSTPPPGATGLWRRLNRDKYYLAPRAEQRSTKLFYIALKDRWPVHWRSFKEPIRGKFLRTT